MTLEELQRLRRECEMRADDNIKLCKEIDQLTAERDGLRAECSKLQEIALRVKLGQLEVWPDASRTELGRQYRALSRENGIHSEQLVVLRSERDALQFDNDRLRAERDASKLAYDTLLTSWADIKARRDEISKENDLLRADLQEARDLASAPPGTAPNYFLQERNRLRAELAEARSSCEQYEAARESWSTGAMTVATQLRELREAADEVRQGFEAESFVVPIGCTNAWLRLCATLAQQLQPPAAEEPEPCCGEFGTGSGMHGDECPEAAGGE